MKINLLYNHSGIKKATGLTIVIDVFRAFSVMYYAFSKGVDDYILSSSFDSSIIFFNKYPRANFIGKNFKDNKPIYNINNSPSEILKHNSFKRIIHHSSAGVEALLNLKNKDEVLIGSFLNVNAIVNYLTSKNVKEVSIVAMGHLGLKNSLEDDLCAEYLLKKLKGDSIDEKMIYEEIERFATPFFIKNGHPISDIDYCLDFNKFDFVLKFINGKIIREDL